MYFLNLVWMNYEMEIDIPKSTQRTGYLVNYELLIEISTYLSSKLCVWLNLQLASVYYLLIRWFMRVISQGSQLLNQLRACRNVETSTQGSFYFIYFGLLVESNLQWSAEGIYMHGHRWSMPKMDEILFILPKVCPFALSNSMDFVAIQFHGIVLHLKKLLLEKKMTLSTRSAMWWNCKHNLSWRRAPQAFRDTREGLR